MGLGRVSADREVEVVRPSRGVWSLSRALRWHLASTGSYFQSLGISGCSVRCLLRIGDGDLVGLDVWLAVDIRTPD